MKFFKLFTTIIISLIVFNPSLQTMELPETTKKSEIEQKNLNANLFWAVFHGKLDDVDQFINEGADINFIDPSTQATPLYIAVSRNYYDIIEYLLENGADIGASPNVLDRAIYNNNSAMVDFLVRHGAPVTRESYNRARNLGDSDIAQYLKTYLPPQRK